MSVQSEQFLIAARRYDWPTAYSYLNGLSMYEMLQSLASLPPQVLIDAQWQLGNYLQTYNVPRIEYALRVVITRELPMPPPGDLRATGQESTAREFLGALLESGKQALNFYHGTSLDQAKKLMTRDLTPMVVSEYSILDWYEYTDFGKGFYTHPEASKQKAVEWAKRKSNDWGVVRFGLTKDEFTGIPGKSLTYTDKRNSRPPNAPVLFDSKPANWIEFVEYNRGVEPLFSGQKTTIGRETTLECGAQSGDGWTAGCLAVGLRFRNVFTKLIGE